MSASQEEARAELSRYDEGYAAGVQLFEESEDPDRDVPDGYEPGDETKGDVYVQGVFDGWAEAQMGMHE